MADYYRYTEEADLAYEKVDARFRAYCEKNNLNPETNASFTAWQAELSAADEAVVNAYYDLADKVEEAYSAAYVALDYNEEALGNVISEITRIETGLWSALIALFIGLFLGAGEGVFYGSREKAVRYALTGAGISVAVGFVSGYMAQLMYAAMLSDYASAFTASYVRGLGWALMGAGVGAAIGLIKPEKKRLLYCTLGGLVGAFIGGFLFNSVCAVIPDDIAARGIAVVIMGALLGVGVGLLEQFAKQAWLKVVRGEFEGKEYLVFAGTTSIGNSGKNTIVLFKDKLVAPHHCDIVLEGSKYVVVDQNSLLGTMVNGVKTTRHVLRQGDAIALGNSVLVFNTK